jgi:GT2 family glycosyltransferase
VSHSPWPGRHGNHLSDAAPAPTLVVQVVFYRHGAETVSVLLRSLGRSIAYAKEHQSIGDTTLLIGDSSPHQVLTAEQVSELWKAESGQAVNGLEYHYFDQNRGSAGGNNFLFALAQSDLVLIINPDCYASPSLISELCQGMSDSHTGIIEARQLPLEHPKEFDRVTGETSWATGACMLVRRSVIELLGGFDEKSFFMYCDDVDFSWRSRLAGYRVLYQPSACVFHDKRLDADGQIVPGEAEVYYSAEASLMMAWKWSRPDLVEWNRERLLTSGSELHRKAVEVFDSRRERNDLPPPLDPERRVAEFEGYNYTLHRFLYED